MVIEFARHALDSNEPNSTEFDASTPYPVIDLLPDQKNTEMIYERHRHRFEFNNRFRTQLQEAGMVYSGLSPDGKLVELCELTNHPWMVSCQFHPEFGSRPGRPHPLFRDFIGAAKDVLREGAQPALPLSS